MNKERIDDLIDILGEEYARIEEERKEERKQLRDKYIEEENKLRIELAQARGTLAGAQAINKRQEDEHKAKLLEFKAREKEIADRHADELARLRAQNTELTQERDGALTDYGKLVLDSEMRSRAAEEEKERWNAERDQLKKDKEAEQERTKQAKEEAKKQIEEATKKMGETEKELKAKIREKNMNLIH